MSAKNEIAIGPQCLETFLISLFKYDPQYTGYINQNEPVALWIQFWRFITASPPFTPWNSLPRRILIWLCSSTLGGCWANRNYYGCVNRNLHLCIVGTTFVHAGTNSYKFWVLTNIVSVGNTGRCLLVHIWLVGSKKDVFKSWCHFYSEKLWRS